jgi:hypothetical protein
MYIWLSVHIEVVRSCTCRCPTFVCLPACKLLTNCLNSPVPIIDVGTAVQCTLGHPQLSFSSTLLAADLNLIHTVYIPQPLEPNAVEKDTLVVNLLEQYITAYFLVVGSQCYMFNV